MTKTLQITAVASIVTISSALAGPAGSYDFTPTESAAATSSGDWCQSLKTFGKFHKDENARFIQELSFSGRTHWQYAAIDGSDVNGNDFDNDFTEFRRVRAGFKARFLNNFTLKGEMNMVSDAARTGGSESFGYANFDILHLSYLAEDVAGFDSLIFRYGNHKLLLGAEATVSSKKIKTVERSGISNTIFKPSYTGLKMLATRGDWSGTLGVYSLDKHDVIGGWNGGNVAAMKSTWQVAGGDLMFDALYNFNADDSGLDEMEVGYEWMTSLSYERGYGDWNLMVNGIYGDKGDEDYSGANRDGAFWGLVVMPSTYIIEDKLEFVARYQYQGSEESEGIRTYSRYFRASDNTENSAINLNSGRGDSHQSLYAGLNYYFCGYNSKLMTGIEYETLDTPDGDADATTLWTAYRMYF